jgi:hypothetical protein
MEQQQPKRTAVQRIEDLERGVMGMFQAADNMGRDLMTCKEAIKLLGNKMDSIVKATQRGEDLTDEVIGNIMIENNVAELKGRVDQLVAAGTLVATTEAVDEKNFLVGQEVDESGKVLNPRLQFVLGALQPELKEKFLGAKVGDSVVFQEGKVKFLLQEAYTVVAKQPDAPAAEAAPAQEQATATTEQAPAAPAQEQAAPATEVVLNPPLNPTLDAGQSSSDASTDPAAQSSQSSGS